jgi:hypothetical protein
MLTSLRYPAAAAKKMLELIIASVAPDRTSVRKMPAQMYFDFLSATIARERWK